MLILKCTEKSAGVVSQRHLEMNLEFRGRQGSEMKCVSFLHVSKSHQGMGYTGFTDVPINLSEDLRQ